MVPLVREQGSFSVEVTLRIRHGKVGQRQSQVYREQDYRQREEEAQEFGPERSLGLLRDGQKGWSRLKEG